MSTAFLSHSSADKAFVRQVAADLQANGVAIWLDERELLPGARLVAGLSEALEAADYVLLFVSSAFLRSNWARVEADAALRRTIESRKSSVIPLLIEDVWAQASPLLQALLYEDFRESQNVLTYRHAIGRVLAALNAPSASLPTTTRKPAVMVSGGRSKTGGRKGLAIARKLGRALATESLPLLTGVGEGIDTEFAEGVAEEAAQQRIDPRKVLTAYVVKDGTRHHSVGRLLQSRYRNRREGIPELVSESDIAFLIGGNKSTMHLGVLMLLEGKIVFPLAVTGGAAEDCYSLIQSRYERVFRQALPRSRFEDLGDHSLSEDEIVQKCLEMLALVSGRGGAT
jgi:hypothetical protein